MAGFKVGDHVTWRSQAAGTWKKKTGVVVQVVPPKVQPSKVRTGAFYRKAESYVVHIPNRGKGTYYWPLVSALKRA